MAPPATSHVRWHILALLFGISIVTYIDRINISVTARQMMPALGLTEVQMGQVFSAFVFGYALCQIPGGWLGDRWGPRLVLTLAVVWWSIFTALTAVAATLPLAGVVGILGSLILVRFLIGVGEAAALPNFNRAVANWLPANERGLGIGVAIGGIGVGSALTPPVVAWIMVNYGWQSAFYLCALLGIVIAIVWYLYARDRPEEHPHVTASEAALIAGEPAGTPLPGHGRTPWMDFARTPTVWWLVLSYTCFGYVAYIYISWFYLYLVNVRGFGELRGAVFSMAPFLAMTLFCVVGGWATDRLVGRLGVNKGRAYVASTGLFLAAGSIVLGAGVDAQLIALGLLSLGAGLLYLTIGAFWSSTVDLAKSHAGALSGLMNTGANLGGTVSPTLTPWIAQRWGWAAALWTAAIIAFCGGLLWVWIRPGHGLRQGGSALTDSVGIRAGGGRA